MRDTVIFLGPTLIRKDAERLLDAQYLPPICRGDLAKLPEHIRFVGIIDGEFFQSLSVSPKEIVELLRRGVTVCGASSMGALRAAETYSLGTVGIGKVFTMFRDGILDADDEVALIYDPHTYRPMSDSLVNLRAALETASAAGIIDETEKHNLTCQMKARYFPERSYRALYALSPRLRKFFAGTPPPNVKRDDAIELLCALRELRTNAQPSHPAAP